MGLRRKARELATRLIVAKPGLARGVVELTGAPRLWDLYENAEHWDTAAPPMLRHLLGPDVDVDGLVAEADHALAAIRARGGDSALSYPSYFAVEDTTAHVLYALVRAWAPEVMLETGVADGLSSALVLQAMHANGRGRLHSIDIRDDVGALVADRDRWQLHVVRDDDQDFARVVRAIGPVDIFFHDGNHDFRHQTLEYETVWPALRTDGLLLTDDADWSCAFLSFTRRHGLRPTMLMDTRKVFGAVRKGHHVSRSTDSDSRRAPRTS